MQLQYLMILLVSFFYLWFTSSPSPVAKALVKLPPNRTVPALIVFGDSIVDAGNNNAINSLIKCDFPPYGKDFQGGVPTGRFCNGRVPSDLIAEELGIKSLLPAYLDPQLQPSELPTGVTFASGGCGYDPLTSQLASVISLTGQLKYMEEYLSKLRGVVGEVKAKFILENSIFLVVAGSDDIANTYFGLRARKNYNISSYTDLMVNSAIDFFKDLYNMGARRIGVFSAPPIGCVPSQRTLAGGIMRECAVEHNLAATLFNQKLSGALRLLRKTLMTTTLVYMDIYNPLLDLIQNPLNKGFEVATEGCCGTGKIEVSILCNKFLPTCSDDSKYVFWDSYHPTEQAYKELSRIVVPKSIGQLVG